MGQNRKEGQGGPRRIDFHEELAEDLKCEKLIGYRQAMIILIIIILVIVREIFYPSHVYITELIFTLDR